MKNKSLFLISLFWASFFMGLWKEPEMNPIPKEGRKIKMTWIKHAMNTPSYVPNAYIGMIGIARRVQPDGSFDLDTGNSWLIVMGNDYKFEYLD